MFHLWALKCGTKSQVDIFMLLVLISGRGINCIEWRSARRQKQCSVDRMILFNVQCPNLRWSIEWKVKEQGRGAFLLWPTSQERRRRSRTIRPTFQSHAFFVKPPLTCGNFRSANIFPFWRSQSLNNSCRTWQSSTHHYLNGLVKSEGNWFLKNDVCWRKRLSTSAESSRSGYRRFSKLSPSRLQPKNVWQVNRPT
jgi:hypothetical protein